MREWGAEALTALIKAGLAYKHDPPLAQNQVGNDTMGYLEEKKNKDESKHALIRHKITTTDRK